MDFKMRRNAGRLVVVTLAKPCFSESSSAKIYVTAYQKVMSARTKLNWFDDCNDNDDKYKNL